MTQLTEQIRVRCTTTERRELEAEARASGVKLSDVVRRRLFPAVRATQPAEQVEADSAAPQRQDRTIPTPRPLGSDPKIKARPPVPGWKP